MHVPFYAIKVFWDEIYWNLCAADFSTLPLTPLLLQHVWIVVAITSIVTKISMFLYLVPKCVHRTHSCWILCRCRRNVVYADRMDTCKSAFQRFVHWLYDFEPVHVGACVRTILFSIKCMRQDEHVWCDDYNVACMLFVLFSTLYILVYSGVLMTFRKF